MGNISVKGAGSLLQFFSTTTNVSDDFRKGLLIGIMALLESHGLRWPECVTYIDKFFKDNEALDKFHPWRDYAPKTWTV